MKAGRIGAALVALGLGALGASSIGTQTAGAATSSIAMICKQSPNITGDTSATFAISYTARTEVEANDSFTLSGVSVPFTNNQGFNLDIGPGTAKFEVFGQATPASFSKSFAKVNVPNSSSTEFGPFSQVITAGPSAGDLSVRVVSVSFDVALAGGNKLTEVTCTPTGDADERTITTVDIILPPPPGAPNANPDSAEVEPGDSVNIAVLVNDEAAELDRASLGEVTAPEIMDAPGEGTAVVEEDGTITYTADADTTATSDSFDYRICTDFDIPTFGRSFVRGEQLPCDTTTVSIGILQPQGTTVAPPTTTEPTQGTSGSSVSPTTDELPMTGSASTPLGAAGFGLALVGIGLVAVSRRHAATR